MAKQPVSNKAYMATEMVRRATANVEAAVEARDKAILAAVSAGATQRPIAEAAGLSQARISQILNEK